MSKLPPIEEPTIEEVAKYWESQRPVGRENGKELFLIIADCIQKQIPKKPILEGYGYAPDGTFVYDEWFCPNCNTRYEVEYEEYYCCPTCGQRIDWSEKYE